MKRIISFLTLTVFLFSQAASTEAAWPFFGQSHLRTQAVVTRPALRDLARALAQDGGRKRRLSPAAEEVLLRHLDDRLTRDKTVEALRELGVESRKQALSLIKRAEGRRTEARDGGRSRRQEWLEKVVGRLEEQVKVRDAVEIARSQRVRIFDSDIQTAAQQSSVEPGEIHAALVERGYASFDDQWSWPHTGYQKMTEGRAPDGGRQKKAGWALAETINAVTHRILGAKDWYKDRALSKDDPVRFAWSVEGGQHTLNRIHVSWEFFERMTPVEFVWAIINEAADDPIFAHHSDRYPMFPLYDFLHQVEAARDGGTTSAPITPEQFAKLPLFYGWIPYGTSKPTSFHLGMVYPGVVSHEIQAVVEALQPGEKPVFVHAYLRPYETEGLEESTLGDGLDVYLEGGVRLTLTAENPGTAELEIVRGEKVKAYPLTELANFLHLPGAKEVIQRASAPDGGTIVAAPFPEFRAATIRLNNQLLVTSP